MSGKMLLFITSLKLTFFFHLDSWRATVPDRVALYHYEECLREWNLRQRHQVRPRWSRRRVTRRLRPRQRLRARVRPTPLLHAASTAPFQPPHPKQDAGLLRAVRRVMRPLLPALRARPALARVAQPLLPLLVLLLQLEQVIAPVL